MQRPVDIDADKSAGDRHFLRVVDQRLRDERRDLLVDRIDPGTDFIGDVLGARPFVFEPVGFLAQRFDPRLIVGARLGRHAIERAVAEGVAIREVDRGLDPLPAFRRDTRHLGFELLGLQPVEQRDVLEPAAVIAFEEIAKNMSACLAIGVERDEQDALVRCPYLVLGQPRADIPRLLRVARGEHIPDLFLPRVIARHRKGHELFERHAVIGVDVVELGRDLRELEALLHDRRRDHEGRRDRFDVGALFDELLHRPELVKRMQRFAMDILGERILFGRHGIILADDAGHRLGLRQAPLFHQHL